MSGFLGLNTALSGLFANQRSLGIVSHNIANANTEGYSRQVMNTKAYRPQILPGNMGTLGTGVDVTAVKQIRDSYLDFKFRSEVSAREEWKARADVLTEIEGIFNEPSDSSMSELLDKYYESLQSLNKNPENLTARTLVRQTTMALSEGMKRMSGMLTSLQRELNFQFQVAVRETNDLAEQIAKLNETIYKVELEGGKANDLRDQRNVLVDKLSELVNVDYYEDEKSRFFVLVGGQQLVAHTRSDGFELVQRQDKLHEDDDDRIMDIQWRNGNPIFLKGGKVKGLMGVRDNIDGNLKGIPYYVSKLNEFTDVLADTMNSIHEKGYGLDRSTGYYMFTMDNMTTAQFKAYLINEGLNQGPAVQVTAGVLDGTTGLTGQALDLKIKDNIEKLLANNPGYAGKSVKNIDGQYYVVDKIKASRMTLAKDLEDLNKFAAATNIEDVPGDGSNILKMIQTRHDISLYAWGTPEDFVKSLVSNLGVDTAEANRVAGNQAQLVKEYTILRDSIMGVSLDEEMANMIKFQTAYNANARMVNVFDEMLDLVVNRLGNVGR